MNIIYLRVSTTEQEVAVQMHGIREYLKSKNIDCGTPEEPAPDFTFHSDTLSSAIPWQHRKIGEIIRNGKEGDVVYVSEVSRIARNILGALEVARDAIANGMTIVATKNNLVLDASLSSRILTVVLGLASEIEVSLIRERTKESLQRRRDAGLPMGRPRGSLGLKKLDRRQPELNSLLAAGLSNKAIAKEMAVSINTVASYVRGLEQREQQQRDQE